MKYKEFIEKHLEIELSGNIQRPYLSFQELFNLIWDKENKPFDYRLTLTNKTSGKSFSFDYTMGKGLLERKKYRGNLKNTVHEHWSMPYFNKPRNIYQLGDMLKKKTSLFGKTWIRPTAPQLPEVLPCLQLDSNVLQYGNFEQWADDLGYDQNSRSAEKIYNQCLKNTLQFRAFLGETVFNELLNCEEE